MCESPARCMRLGMSDCYQGMKQLKIQVFDLVADPHHAADEEEKISSSSARKRLLGTLLRPPLKVSRTTKSNFIFSQEIRFRKLQLDKKASDCQFY